MMRLWLLVWLGNYCNRLCGIDWPNQAKPAKGEIKEMPSLPTVCAPERCTPTATCGKRPEVLHMPTKALGWYCENCCPACSVAPAPVNGKRRIERGAC